MCKYAEKKFHECRKKTREKKEKKGRGGGGGESTAIEGGRGERGVISITTYMYHTRVCMYVCTYKIGPISKKRKKLWL